MKTLKLLFMLAFVSAFVSCVNDDDYNTPDLSGQCGDHIVTKSANDVLALATAPPTLYTANDTIEAYVTSSDEGGNFYKTVSFITADTTKAFSMPMDAYNLYTKFEPGRKVYIALKDLYVGKDFNANLIGELYNGRVGRIGGSVYKKVVLPSCEKIDEEKFIKRRTILQAMKDEYLNMLIEFDSVQFTDASNGATYFDASLPSPGGATNHKIIDRQGTEVILRVSEYATFNKNLTPTTSGKIRGVMTKYNNDYQFMIRTLADVQLDQPRITKAPVPPPVPGLEPPSASAVLAFKGANFENYADFLSGVNSFGVKSYASQSAGNGRNGTAGFRIQGTPTANDYVFTSFAGPGLPANPTKIHFYIKGTSSKTVSINVYKNDGSYVVFNLGDLTDSKILTPAPSNQYTGVINTGGEWKLVVLDISTIASTLNLTNTAANFFALKVGSNQPYDLYFDNFTIQP